MVEADASSFCCSANGVSLRRPQWEPVAAVWGRSRPHSGEVPWTGSRRPPRQCSDRNTERRHALVHSSQALSSIGLRTPTGQLEEFRMKTILSFVAASGLLIWSAGIGFAQQGGAPGGGTTGGSAGSTAPFGSSPGSAAPFGSSPGSAAPFGSSPSNPAAPGNSQGSDSRTGPGGGAWITGPGGTSSVERHDGSRPDRQDLTTGRADRGSCTTQTYRVPSEETGATTSVDVTRC
jgi:hypothetical protein